MKIVIPGGSGQVGNVVARAFHERGDEAIVLSRTETNTFPWRVVKWDGETLGKWASEIEGAEAVINLAGQSVRRLTFARVGVRSQVENNSSFIVRVFGSAARCAEGL
jgi:NAD dependent epimerase/dehydratase family enzyme